MERIVAATKNRILYLVVTFVLLAALMTTAVADVVQPGEDFWYLDEADVLSVETEGEIFFANQRLYDACGAEIVVVAVDSTGGMPIDDYAYTLFNEWEIGGSKYLGFLLLMAIEDDDYYAMPGTMLGTYIDSARIAELLDTHLLPEFSRGGYDAGARSFFEAVYAEVADVLNLNLSIDEAKKDYQAFICAEDTENTSVVNGRAPEEHYDISVGTIVLIILLLIILSRVTKKFHAAKKVYAQPSARWHVHAVPKRPSSANSSMAAGYMLGRMVGAARNRHAGSAPFASHGNGRVGAGRNFGGSSINRSSGIGNGMKTSSPSRSFSGFGGASRSGGSSRGPSTRGGGAGRFSRR